MVRPEADEGARRSRPSRPPLSGISPAPRRDRRSVRYSAAISRLRRSAAHRRLFRLRPRRLNQLESVASFVRSAASRSTWRRSCSSKDRRAVRASRQAPARRARQCRAARFLDSRKPRGSDAAAARSPSPRAQNRSDLGREAALRVVRHRSRHKGSPREQNTSKTV